MFFLMSLTQYLAHMCCISRQGCYNRTPQTKWLGQQNSVPLSSAGWQIQDQGPAGFGF